MDGWVEERTVWELDPFVVVFDADVLGVVDVAMVVGVVPVGRD